MERNWYWKTGLVVAVAIFSVWQLVPSWHYFQLPPDQRLGERYEQSVPGWAPSAKKHINLGLDLQGGIHLALGVDVDRAVKAKIARRSDEIAEHLKSKGLAFTASAPDATGLRIAVATSAAADVEKETLDFYGSELYSPGGAPEGQVLFAYKDQVLRDFKIKAVDQAEKTIRNRVDKWGVSEPDIKRKANNQIQIQLPGFKDPEKAKDLLGRTAQLEFKICDDENPVLDQLRSQLPPCPTGRDGLAFPLPAGGCWRMEQSLTVLAEKRTELEAVIAAKLTPLLDRTKNVIGIGQDEVGSDLERRTYYKTYLLRAKTELTGDYIADAGTSVDSSGPGQGRPVVTFSMSPDGARLMERLTTENLGKRMATVLDDKVETAPVIQGKISDRGQISMGSSRDYAKLQEEVNSIATVLKAGALPAPVTIFEERTVGATLGPELVKKGTLAALVGLAAVLLFMVAYYRVSGLVADLALVLNGLLVLAVMAIFNTTLTLPGIAGFVLTLGMAVDANVLINERIREEMRAGRTVKQAVQQGYDKVFLTIVDAHVTTLVAAFVLMTYGSGPVKGFAVALAIGLAASMFTSIVVTRVIMDFLTRGDTARLSV